MERMIKTILEQDFTMAEKRSPSYALIRESLIPISQKLASLAVSVNPFVAPSKQHPTLMDFNT